MQGLFAEAKVPVLLSLTFEISSSVLWFSSTQI